MQTLVYTYKAYKNKVTSMEQDSFSSGKWQAKAHRTNTMAKGSIFFSQLTKNSIFKLHLVGGIYFLQLEFTKLKRHYFPVTKYLIFEKKQLSFPIFCYFLYIKWLKDHKVLHTSFSFHLQNNWLEPYLKITSLEKWSDLLKVTHWAS